MSWSSFHFKCRFFVKKLDEGFTVNQAVESFEASGLNTFYAQVPMTTLQHSLFDKVLTIPNQLQIRDALALYADFDFENSLTTSKAYKSIINSLSYFESILLIFVMVSTVYKFYVYPAFYEMASQSLLVMPSYFVSFEAIWIAGITIAFLIAIFSIIFRQTINNIDNLVINLPSKTLSLFMPKQLTNKISQFNQVILSPFSQQNDSSEFQQNLAYLSRIGMDKNVEIFSLSKAYSQSLEQYIWFNAKKIISVLYALLSVGIAFYIMQIYQSIFSIGAMVG